MNRCRDVGDEHRSDPCSRFSARWSFLSCCVVFREEGRELRYLGG
jgi:hypothetical protein